MLEFICYPKCTTCTKARKWLDKNEIEYRERNIKEDHLSADELKNVIARSGVSARKLFNTSGKLYREMGLKDKLPDMSENDMIDLLASDGMLVKRPIAINDNTALIGFKETEWAEKLL